MLFVLIAVVSLSSASGEESSPPGVRGPSGIERFIPVGWELIQSVEGDLNGDGTADVAAVLLRDEAANANPVEHAGSRGLLVLFADPAGGYRFQDFAPEALPCDACLGDLGGDPQTPVFELAIADRRLTLGWRSDFGETTKVKLIIGYDPKRDALRLLGDEILTTERLSGKPSLQIRDYEAGTKSINGRKTRFPPKFVPLIQVSAEDY